MPINPHTGGLAKVNDATTWGTFEEAGRKAASLSEGRVGFVFTESDPFVALDFDECLDEAGSLTERGRELVEPFIGKAYVARSQSGRGIHVITQARPAHTGNRKAEQGVEVYDRGRFLALTGVVYQGAADIGNAQAEVDELVAKAWRDSGPAITTAANDPVLDCSQTWPSLAEEFQKTVAALGVVGQAIRSDGELSYSKWIETVVMPLQGTFGGTPLEPAVKRLFADFTRKLPGYRPGDETKLNSFRRVAGPRRTMATVYAVADQVDRSWRRELAQRETYEEGDTTLPTEFDPGGEAFDGNIEPPRFVIPPYFPKRRFVLIAGPHGSFKSLVGLDAVLTAAAGMQWGGAGAECTRSAFASMEDPADTIRRRIRAFQVGREFETEGERAIREAAIRDRVFYLGAEKLRGMYLTDVERGMCRIRQCAIDAWVALLNNEGIGFAILETASRLHRGAETNEALPRTDAIEEVLDRSRYGLALGIIHHSSQEDARRKRVDSYVGRGATTTADRARGVLAIERADRSNLAVVRLSHEKPGTDSPRGDAVMWEPEVNSVGIYLRPFAAEEAVASDAAALLAHIEAEGGAVTERALGDARKAPDKLSIRNHRGRLALEHLLEDGRLERLDNVPRGKTRATVYRVKRSA